RRDARVDSAPGQGRLDESAGIRLETSERSRKLERDVEMTVVDRSQLDRERDARTGGVGAAVSCHAADHAGLATVPGRWWRSPAPRPQYRKRPLASMCCVKRAVAGARGRLIQSAPVPPAPGPPRTVEFPGRNRCTRRPPIRS